MGSSASCIEDKESVRKLIAACIARHREEYTKLGDCSSSSDRSCKSGKLCNSFEVEQKILARISEIKQSDASFYMERKILKQNKNVPIGRSSSPTRDAVNTSAHLQEDLSSTINEDNDEDTLMYPQWKNYLEQMEVIPVDSPIIPEAISAGSTPNWFPITTPLEPLSPSSSTSSHRSNEPKPSSSCPVRRPTKVFYHVTVLNELDNDLEVTPEQRPTPYQLYMQHQMGEEKPRVFVWMPAKAKNHSTNPSQTPPPVPRHLKPKPKPTDSPEVKTYRRKDSDRSLP